MLQLGTRLPLIPQNLSVCSESEGPPDTLRPVRGVLAWHTCEKIKGIWTVAPSTSIERAAFLKSAREKHQCKYHAGRAVGQLLCAIIGEHEPVWTGPKMPSIQSKSEVPQDPTTHTAHDGSRRGSSSSRFTCASRAAFQTHGTPRLIITATPLFPCPAPTPPLTSFLPGFGLPFFAPVFDTLFRFIPQTSRRYPLRKLLQLRTLSAPSTRVSPQQKSILPLLFASSPRTLQIKSSIPARL